MTDELAHKGKIGVLIEAHFDETEYRRFNEFFPEHGYDVEYLSHLWNQPSLTFTGNDFSEQATVSTELNGADLADYAGIILIGGYAMDRLRYEESPKPGAPNRAPAVEFLRRAVAAMDEGWLPVGTICHSLWLFCAAPETLAGRRVTCAHNIKCDVEAAGGVYVFNAAGDAGADVHVDGGLITGRHPGVVEPFMATFLRELDARSRAANRSAA